MIDFVYYVVPATSESQVIRLGIHNILLKYGICTNVPIFNNSEKVIQDRR